MKINLYLPNCRKGATTPIADMEIPGAARWADAPPARSLPAGTGLYGISGDRLFMATSRICLPVLDAGASITMKLCPLLMAEREILASDGPVALDARKDGYSLAVITLSDKASQGLRRDESGPLLARMARGALPVGFCSLFILPDETGALKSLLAELALVLDYDLILTTGGTGLSPRDITPQATRPLLDMELPGFSQAMMAASLNHTPNAAISRGIAGVIGQSIVINFPGSKKGAGENMEAILSALPHALKKLHGDPADCGG